MTTPAELPSRPPDEPTQYRIIVCPSCEQTTLPPGALDYRCPCGTLFAAEGGPEQPRDVRSRDDGRHATAGRRITVTAAPCAANAPQFEGTTARDGHLDVERRVLVGQALLASVSLGKVLRRQQDGKIHCAMSCADVKKLAALMEETGEVAQVMHDEDGTVRHILELLDTATAAIAWTGYLFETLRPAERRETLTHAAEQRLAADTIMADLR